MPKFQPMPAFIAAAHATRPASREVGLPLYLPAFDEREFLTAPRREGEDGDELVVDASGITIGGDDEDDADY